MGVLTAVKESVGIVAIKRQKKSNLSKKLLSLLRKYASAKMRNRLFLELILLLIMTTIKVNPRSFTSLQKKRTTLNGQICQMKSVSSTMSTIQINKLTIVLFLWKGIPMERENSGNSTSTGWLLPQVTSMHLSTTIEEHTAIYLKLISC